MTADWASRGMGGDRNPSHARGTTQSGVRLYNERLVLSLIRFHGQLPKAEIARLTGLSAQTVSVIVRQLESDGLLVRRTPQRGKVGQPLVPFELDPEGAFSVGLKVGRRSGDLMLLDLSGGVRQTIHRPYAFPTPGELLAFVSEGLQELQDGLTGLQRARICGLGIAAPFELWNWADELGAAAHVLNAWRGFDLKSEIERLAEWPVHYCNDASAACAAELLFGQGQDHRDYAYFYLGYFIGGGIVINGSLYLGHRGNAGALASFPVAAAEGRSSQLVHRASIAALEREIRKDGNDPEMLWSGPQDWTGAGAALDRWLHAAASDIAVAAAGIVSVLDCAAIIVDGAIPVDVRSRLVQQIRDALLGIDTQGISPCPIIEGTIGFDARAMGAASLPLFDNFIVNRNVLFKEQD